MNTILIEDQSLVEQTSFYNNSYGINESIQHIKGCYNKENAIAVCESTGNYFGIVKPPQKMFDSAGVIIPSVNPFLFWSSAR